MSFNDMVRKCREYSKSSAGSIMKEMVLGDEPMAFNIVVNGKSIVMENLVQKYNADYFSDFSGNGLVDIDNGGACWFGSYPLSDSELDVLKSSTDDEWRYDECEVIGFVLYINPDGRYEFNVYTQDGDFEPIDLSYTNGNGNTFDSIRNSFESYCNNEFNAILK